MLKDVVSKYFEDEIKEDYDLVKNYKNRRVIFKEKININGEEVVCYIKKYIPYRKPKKLIILGLRDDPCTHYKKIAKSLERININVVKDVITLEKRETFFHRKYIVVTPYAGESLVKYVKEFKKFKKYFIKFFDYFILMCKNKIYCTDYNLGGFLISGEDISIIDLDAYKVNKKISKRLKLKMFESLEKNYLLGNSEEEFIQFFKEQLERVKKELGWEEIETGDLNLYKY
ncbi:hypothetical protein [Fusobacterium sp. MFO224]|uniref:hypothetical protein n=1 Tax=Fusobacterium sp. MFO224 TaxID=3378070 RepID=UPI0038535ED0